MSKVDKNFLDISHHTSISIIQTDYWSQRRNMRRPESYYFPYHVFGDNSEESLNDKNSFKVSSWREHFGRQWSSSTGYHNTIKPLLPSYRYKTELAFGLLTYHQMALPKVTRCFLLGYQECKGN